MDQTKLFPSSKTKFPSEILRTDVFLSETGLSRLATQTIVCIESSWYHIPMYKFVELPGLKKPILKVPLEERSVWSPERVKLAEIVSAAEETWMQMKKRKKKEERVQKKETMRKA